MQDYRFAALLALSVICGCGGGQPRGPGGTMLEEPTATASLVDSTGARVGVATFSDSGGTGRLAISVTGLEPGLHGMHVHENGSCTTPDFQSAGSHFNPGSKQHGSRNSEGPHAGDLPNLMVEEDGSADTALTVSSSLLAPGPGSMLVTQQRSLVIHADPDDETTDPSGNSGARLVCGVIERR
jgi:Cu-Zn family superoxide dismutase